MSTDKYRGKKQVMLKTFHMFKFISNHSTVSSLFTSDFLLRCLRVITTTSVNDFRKKG